MECTGFIFALVVGAIIYAILHSRPEPRDTRPPEPSFGSGLNGLFALFLLDRWMDHGADGLFGGSDERQPDLDDQEEDHWHDPNDEDGYWTDRAGF